MWICRPFADVAQLVEHFTRKKVQRLGRMGRKLAQQSRFPAGSWVAASGITWSSVIAFGPVSAPLAVSAQYGAGPSSRSTSASAEALIELMQGGKPTLPRM